MPYSIQYTILRQIHEIQINCICFENKHHFFRVTEANYDFWAFYFRSNYIRICNKKPITFICNCSLWNALISFHLSYTYSHSMSESHAWMDQSDDISNKENLSRNTVSNTSYVQCTAAEQRDVWNEQMNNQQTVFCLAGDSTHTIDYRA